MKKAPATTKTQGAFQNHEQHFDSIKLNRFTGTDNPRHLRAIAAVMARPRRREDIDSIAGCSNAPELIAELRRRGLEFPCQRIRFIDRDGYPCRPGVYSLTDSDRRKVWAWQARMLKGGAT